MQTRVQASPGSRPVSSNQTDAHEQLEHVVRQHLDIPWRAPLAGHTVEAFESLKELLVLDESRSLILDSGCGTGRSTRELGRMYPDCVVIGVDRSAHRLRSGTGRTRWPFREGNCVWLRAELTSFWRLLLDEGWSLHRHYFLYPNPWPKYSQLRKRWHGHPVFPVILRLGGLIELRTNWSIYAQEFARAAELATGQAAGMESLIAAEPISPFERKYAASGHPLYRVQWDGGVYTRFGME